MGGWGRGEGAGKFGGGGQKSFETPKRRSKSFKPPKKGTKSFQISRGVEKEYSHFNLKDEYESGSVCFV